MTRTNWLRAIAMCALAVVALLGAILVLFRHDWSRPVEISLAEPPGPRGEIYIGQGVTMPGTFPFTGNDTVGDLIEAAGGLAQGASIDHLSLTILSDNDSPQRVDINRAGTWLLEALPGIGEVLAQRIVDYRQQNGAFKNTIDLTKVSGLGKDTYNKIRELITVSGP